MASFRKHGKGWRAEVARLGVRRSKVFDTRAEAKDWAARQEYLILNANKEASRQPFSEVMDRYAREVSDGKRGARWEIIRLAKLSKSALGKIAIGELQASDFAVWRDRRLREVAPGTVRREMILLSSVLTQARKEWGLISESPMRDVRKPTQPPARDRRPTQDEMERLAISAGSDLANATARAFHAFLFSVETGMRAGEVVGLTWADLDLRHRVARLQMTKNGTAREVPLSSEAVRLLESLPEADSVFDLSTRQLDSLWRKLRDRAGVNGLTYHDSRAEAATRMSKKVDVLTLARIMGHRDIRMLMIYYRESASDIAKLLD